MARLTPRRSVFLHLLTVPLLAAVSLSYFACAKAKPPTPPPPGEPPPGGGGGPGIVENPVAKREMRAAFVTVAYNYDWPSWNTATEAQQIAQIRAVVTRAKELKLNVIVLQVRAFGDRIQKKTNHKDPWSRFVNNGQETPNYDPLCQWLRVCHENGIELHAWVNPFRTKDGNSPDPGTVPVPKKYKKQWFLDPTHDKVHDHVLEKVIDQLLKVKCKYDDTVTDVPDGGPVVKGRLEDEGGIDGILIDHYVPEPPDPGAGGGGMTQPAPPIGGTVVPDGGANAARPMSGSGSGAATSSAVMTAHKAKVNDFVFKLYTKVEKNRPVKFGISPERDPDVNPAADVEEWLTKGWFHYMVPEIYIAPGVDFDASLEWYIDNNSTALQVPPPPTKPKPIIVAGLLTTRVEKPDPPIPTTWPASYIRDEVDKSALIFGLKKVKGGQAHYSYSALRSEAQSGPPTSNNVGDLLRDTAYAEPALVPACVDPGNTALPAQPTIDPPALQNTGLYEVTWSTSNTPWLWALFTRTGPTAQWEMQVLPRHKKETTVPAGTRVVLRAVDRFNREGPQAARNVP